MANKIETIAHALPLEIERTEELLKEYERIGQVGSFGTVHIRQSLARAKAAISNQDLIEMIAAYEILNNIQ